MSDVQQGGATVFPSLNVSLQPRRGTAAFWYNLHPSGQGDYQTRHAACPVLIGSKWGMYHIAKLRIHVLIQFQLLFPRKFATNGFTNSSKTSCDPVIFTRMHRSMSTSKDLHAKWHVRLTESNTPNSTSQYNRKLILTSSFTQII